MSVSPEEFAAEQAHLSATHATLSAICEEVGSRMKAKLAEAVENRNDALETLATDYDNGTNLETYAEFEAINRAIDAYNMQHAQDADRLRKARALLERPYFAKLTLRFKEGAEPKEVYLGIAGMVDEQCRHFIVDWRSPVGEVYYNQASGPTSYGTPDGRTIHVDLLGRRQFKLHRDVLDACFDTNVAIEDDLLMEALSGNRSDKLADITATIQTEQNAVIRHEDVPALLVNGVAGSGKTSILLQRVAYLLYKLRDQLNWDHVFLITPNDVFRTYIDEVLPSMGEHNPQIVTWKELMAKIGLAGRQTGAVINADELRRVDELLPKFQLQDKDFKDIKVGDEIVIPAAQARAVYKQFSRFPQGPHRSGLVMDELHEKLEARIARLCRQEATQDELFDLSTEEMEKIFGRVLVLQGEEDLTELTRQMLEVRYRGIDDLIEDGAWLKVDRIGMRMLGRQNLTAEEWLYVKLAFVGSADRKARFVMVDEVQDYTEAQLMMMTRYFSNAHFLLLGDPNQAVKPGTASFADIRRVMTGIKGSVDECHLRTSYRSTPEITSLFMGLAEEAEGVQAQSVQPSGAAPVIMPCENRAQWETALRGAVAEALERSQDAAGGYLVAVIAETSEGAEAIHEMLAELPHTHLVGRVALPTEGLVVCDVLTAKGLEFDEVIIPNASAKAYPADSRLHRNRLYTAISRATKRLTILSGGPLTELLRANTALQP